MRPMPSLALFAATILLLVSPLAAQESATVEQASAVVDLSTFPLPADAVAEVPRRLANLAYDSPGNPRSGYASLAKTLGELGWKELPGGYLDDQSCSGAFGKGGFTLSVSAMPAKEGKVTVRMTNLGNVDLARLPVPPGTKAMYAFPATAAYTSDRPAEEVGAALHTLLIAKGWSPYGHAGDARYYRKNAVKLTARPVASPEGKTILQFSSELMSVELPAPADALAVAYADTTKAMSLDVAMNQAALVAFYKDALGRSGWKATSEAPIKLDFREMLIFRGPAREFLTLKMHPIDGKLRANLEHRTAAEFEEEIRLAEAAEAKRKAGSEMAIKQAAEAAAKARISVAFPVPSAAREVERRKDAVNFKLAAGQSLAAVQAIHDAAIRDGWKEKGRPKPLDAMAGTVSLAKGPGVLLNIVYIDTGFGDAEVKVNAFGADIASP